MSVRLLDMIDNRVKCKFKTILLVLWRDGAQLRVYSTISFIPVWYIRIKETHKSSLHKRKLHCIGSLLFFWYLKVSHPHTRVHWLWCVWKLHCSQAKPCKSELKMCQAHTKMLNICLPWVVWWGACMQVCFSITYKSALHSLQQSNRGLWI